jgi:ADP-dependent NAD(P)H-hydrate dehydratase
MSDATVVTSAMLRDWSLPDVSEGAGKRARGDVLVIGGAADTPGAVLLAGVAALRVGAGRLTVATVESTASALGVALPEAAVIALPDDDGRLGMRAVDRARELVADADVLLVGPGMRGVDDAKEFVAGLLPSLDDDAYLVADALGLTCGAIDADASARVGGRLVVTPNAEEALRLLDGDASDRDRTDIDDGTAHDLAARLGAVVALESNIAAPDGRRWIDGSGNSGLGTSGSGDVLAGAIAGLCARGAAPEQAAVWGVHLHAQAGERLAARIGRLGYLAREVPGELPAVLAELEA